MNRPRSLRLLISSAVVLIALLSLVTTTVSSSATSYAATKKFDASRLITARPLWKYAKKVGGRNPFTSIPGCIDSPTAPRCYSPAQLRDTYNIQPLLNRGFTGKGQTIVIIDGSTSPTLRADVHLYDQLYGLPDPKINEIYPTGNAVYDPGTYQETALDVEMAHALAPAATIDLVVFDESNGFSPAAYMTSLIGATKYAVDHNLGSIISISYGVGESCVGSAYLQLQEQAFAAARAKGISILVSSGDSGALQLSCVGGQILLDRGVAVPSSHPLVTAVGGTTLEAAVGSGAYNSETTWNEWNAGYGATGGGYSTLYPTPNYQQSLVSNSGGGGSSGRGVPDVAFDADPLTGVVVVLSLSGSTYIVPFGGTSVGAPAWAGVVALANQYAGHRLGFLNPSLYKIAKSKAYSRSFNDVTTGNNTVSNYDRFGNPIIVPGYSAGPGWDAVTGVGTPKASGLIPALASA